jgi:radical SAM superfamily enzyme
MLFTDGCGFCREKGKKDGKQKRKTRPTLHQDIKQHAHVARTTMTMQM